MPHFDSGQLEDYPAQLYAAVETVQPIHGFDAVTAADLARYRSDGFLAIADAFSAAALDAARQGLAHLIAGHRPDFEGVMFEAWAKERLDQLHGDQRLDAVRRLMGFVNYDDRLRALERQPKLQALVAGLLGATPALFQDMALLKPPGGREKPWHQDQAYFDYPLTAPVVGVWIALDDVDTVNGCMHVLPGQHRTGARPHFQRRDWQICDTDILRQPVAAVPLRAGGCLVFDGLLPHGTPANRSQQRRRALQFHYAAAGTPKLATAERLRVFGGEGRNVTC